MNGRSVRTYDDYLTISAVIFNRSNVVECTQTADGGTYVGNFAYSECVPWNTSKPFRNYVSGEEFYFNTDELFPLDRGVDNAKNYCRNPRNPYSPSDKNGRYSILWCLIDPGGEQLSFRACATIPTCGPYTGVLCVVVAEPEFVYLTLTTTDIAAEMPADAFLVIRPTSLMAPKVIPPNDNFIFNQKLRQFRCIATYSRRLVAPQTSAILNRSTRQHDTSYSRQPFVLTEFTSASISNRWLDSRWQDWLHCLTWLTNCHQHSHVSSTHARAHALWCAVKRDLVTHHDITYLPRDRSVLVSWPWPLTTWPATFVVHRLSRDQTMHASPAP